MKKCFKNTGREKKKPLAGDTETKENFWKQCEAF